MVGVFSPYTMRAQFSTRSVPIQEARERRGDKMTGLCQSGKSVAMHTRGIDISHAGFGRSRV